MTAHHLSITALEEYAPNAEFAGRNFNAGEVVQLVLRRGRGRTGHPRNGGGGGGSHGHDHGYSYSYHKNEDEDAGAGWLEFRSVQMVMVHELAHCVQMNHSAAFWAVRNALAAELRALWARGYTGDGFWGRGETVLSALYGSPGRGREEEGMLPTPRTLCGGTFRSDGRSRTGKRKRKVGVSYAEREQRRVARRFGQGGVPLGDDAQARVRLEAGKVVKGKPRVAGSARGRDLRAAAALARFGEGKGKTEKEEDDGGKREKGGGKGKWEQSGSDDDDDGSGDGGGGYEEQAVDLLTGTKMLDRHGRGLIRCCEEEDRDDIRVKLEMNEIRALDSIKSHTAPSPRIQHTDESSAPVKREKQSEKSLWNNQHEIKFHTPGN